MSDSESMPAGYYPFTATEQEFQSSVLAYAHLMGWKTYHTFDSRRSAHGFPDLTLVRQGRLVFAELKSEWGRVTVPQSAWLDDLGAVPGVEAFLWRPSDWDVIGRVLAR